MIYFVSGYDSWFMILGTSSMIIHCFLWCVSTLCQNFVSFHLFMKTSLCLNGLYVVLEVHIVSLHVRDRLKTC